MKGNHSTAGEGSTDLDVVVFCKYKSTNTQILISGEPIFGERPLVAVLCTLYLSSWRNFGKKFHIKKLSVTAVLTIEVSYFDPSINQ